MIKRVSTLFRGHKELILQFNTFLPAGYKINEADLDDINHPAYVPPSARMTGPGTRRSGYDDDGYGDGYGSYGYGGYDSRLVPDSGLESGTP